MSKSVSKRRSRLRAFLKYAFFMFFLLRHLKMAVSARSSGRGLSNGSGLEGAGRVEWRSDRIISCLFAVA